MKTIITVQHTQSVHHTNGHAGAWGDCELWTRGHAVSLAAVQAQFRVLKLIKMEL